MLDITSITVLLAGAAGLVVAAAIRAHRRRAGGVADGDRVGDYRLIRKLGEGGMGEVWCAEHSRLGRPAAVKMMRVRGMAAGSGPGENALARFAREAQITAALESFNTVKVFDYGTTSDGRAYYAMELLRGVDLDLLVREGAPMPPSRAIHILKQVCDSLSEAHAAGLVHRDIKPANIVVCSYAGQRDVVKVLDFGLATAHRGDERADALSGDGALVGTPAYIAPEQIAHDHAASPQSDIYNLGCVAYWLVTGRQVFEGSRPIEVLAAHLKDAPTPPSAVRPDVPPALDALIMQCLDKRPDARPAGAAAVRAVLDGIEHASAARVGSGPDALAAGACGAR